MFLRNLLRVLTLVTFMVVFCLAIFAGPLLNIAGVISVMWAMLLLFSSVVLLLTTIITYGNKISNFLKGEQK
jgi:hypothetical protein